MLLSARAANTVERAIVSRACAWMCTRRSIRASRAVEVCLDYLAHLGVEWPPHPTREQALGEYERIWSLLDGRNIEDLIELPLLSDPAMLGTLDVLTEVVTPALFTDRNLLSLVICRMVNLSLEHGNSDGSCFAYVWLGMIAGPHFDNYEAGFQFGRLGYELVERRGLHRYQARTYMSFGNLVMPWTRHVRTGRDLVRRAFDAANKAGDLTFAAYSRNNLNTNLLAAGDRLADAQREAEQGLDFAQKARFGLVIDIITAQLGLIRMLRGLTPTFGSFDDEQFDERRFESHLASQPDLALPECWYWIRKLQARVLAGDYRSAIDAASKAQPLLWTSPSFFETAEYEFYGGLARAGFCHSIPSEEQPQHRTRCPPITDSSKSGRRIVRRISRAARHWSARRSHASTAASSMPSSCTNRRSGRHMKRLRPERGTGVRVGRAILRGARLRRHRASLSAACPARATRDGAPTARCGSSTSGTRA